MPRRQRNGRHRRFHCLAIEVGAAIRPDDKAVGDAVAEHTSPPSRITNTYSNRATTGRTPPGESSRSFGSYAAAAGISEHVHPHLFRHQMLTSPTQGVPDAAIQLISGHSRKSLEVPAPVAVAGRTGVPESAPARDLRAVVRKNSIRGFSAQCTIVTS
jgi:hypothetical protein